MYILKYAFKNIIRNPFISLSSLVVIGLLLFFINILFLTLFSTHSFIWNINDRISITIPFQEWYTDTTIRTQELLWVLKSSFPEIDSKYVSEDEAFLLFRARNPDLAALIEWTDENPLPNSLRLSGIPLDSYERVRGIVAWYKDILEYNETELNKKLIDFQGQYSRIESLVKVLRYLEYAVYGLLGLFIFTVFVVVYTVISNTIFFLRDEMSIIELVWGRSYFIYGPLVIQGMVYTGISAILGAVLFYTFPHILPLDSLPNWVRNVLDNFMILYKSYVIYGIFGAILLWKISAFLASWKYIHKTIG